MTDSARTERKRMNPPKLRLTMLKIDILNEHLSVVLSRLQSMNIKVQCLDLSSRGYIAEMLEARVPIGHLLITNLTGTLFKELNPTSKK